MRRADPLERHIEMALAPGEFIGWRRSSEFVSELEEVEAGLRPLLASDPSRALPLYDAFLAGCYAKAEELDDSSGSFGQFVGALYAGWIKARQAAAADPGETAALLVERMEKDPYGFASDLDRDGFAVLDRDGRAAFVQAIRTRFDAMAGDHRWPWSDVLRRIYIAQRNVSGYLAVAEQTRLKTEDCVAVAKMLVSRRKLDEALAWVDRGLQLAKKDHGSGGYELAALRRELLAKQGRGDEALEAAWAEYRAHPSRYSFEDLMKYVPRAERAAWREKALDAATGRDLSSLLELFLVTKELDRLAELVRRTPDAGLKGQSHYATEPVARTLEKKHPDLAARLWLAQGLRIVEAKKSRYYDAAISNLDRARACYGKAGRDEDWMKIVARVRAEHHRKSSFIDGFEAMVAREGAVKPSFLEQAKARWGRR